MKRYWQASSCIYVDKDTQRDERCPYVATYIVLDRGQAMGKVPIACTYPDNYYGRVPAARRMGALYCRTHAYLVCGKEPPSSV